MTTFYVDQFGGLYHGDMMEGDREATPEELAARELAIKNAQSVTMVQARLALLASGHLSTVNAAIAAMPGVEGEAARVEWEFRPTVLRGSALTQAMAAVLNLDDQGLDNLFSLAATL